ncbi:hypothetical protein Acear_1094 [Acetohalobium arabaticum DSM 5501]|uniref:Uncharacterized protein n=1 Tax=Acetohalobium arabaticum (strain ATCC 49924 / DSM 5501 / Z-7288) TaxID=574087 RepID=D9QQ26_ACEAZ|nr:hypothetical protein Acear_1094 [Acetohalobium arabaticum DSM 5501]
MGRVKKLISIIFILRFVVVNDMFTFDSGDIIEEMG